MISPLQLSLLLLALSLAFANNLPTTTDNDIVLINGGRGTEIVLRSVVRLRAEAIVESNESQFLRRIAYVETRDGSTAALEEGGIWGVDYTSFRKTQAPDVEELTKLKIAQIEHSFGIKWTSVEWTELSKPLYSAIAAHLVLHLVKPSLLPPHTDVEGQAQFWKSHYNTNGSLEAFINAVNQLEGSSSKNSGSEYYIGFPHNFPEATQFLLISTLGRDPAPITVTTSSGLFFSENIKTKVLDLGSKYQVEGSSDRLKGIHLSSSGDEAVSVHGLSYHRYTSDGYLALPCAHQPQLSQYDYHALSYGNMSGPNQVLLIACEDNTTVTLEKTSITLNRMETFLREDTADITGTRFVSNKPISFYSGHLCAYIPRDVHACDHIIEQFPPTAEWGTEFLLASLYGRSSADIYRIVSSAHSNTINVCCNNLLNLKSYKYRLKMNSEGEWEELVLPSGYSCSVQSSFPILVAQFGLGFESDNNIGDPFMMMVPSIEQYANSYTFHTLSNFPVNYATILVPPEHFQPAKIIMDQESLQDSKWTAINCRDERVCGYVTYVRLEEGTHRVYHMNAVSFIGVLVYGFDLYNSYGYPAGLKPIHRKAIISFSKDVYTVSEGEGTITISLLRSSSNTTEKTVAMIGSWSLGSSATESKDYSSVNELVVFEAGEIEKHIQVEITDDQEIEGVEMILLFLSSGDDVQLYPHAEAQVRITDDDVAEFEHARSDLGVTINSGPVIESGGAVSINWSPTSLSPSSNGTIINTSVDIILCALDHHIDPPCLPLSTGLPNTGHAVVSLPLSLFPSHDGLKYSLLPVVFEISPSLQHPPFTNQSPLLSSKLGLGNSGVVKQSPLRLLSLLPNPLDRSEACQARAKAMKTNKQSGALPHCPCTEQYILSLPSSNFEKDASYFNFPLRENQTSNEWLVDDVIKDFTNVSSCYRSMREDSSQQQWCCYNDIGNLITTSPPDNYLRDEVIPRWLCCRSPASTDCDLYHQKPLCSQTQP